MKTKLLIGVLSALFLLDVAFAIPMSRTAAQVPSASQSDKSDGECTGHETAGRCADKCPTGSYSIGFDKETGAAICKKEPTGCPYGDSIPLDSPKCAPSPEELQHQQAQANVTENAVTDTPESWGK